MIALYLKRLDELEKERIKNAIHEEPTYEKTNRRAIKLKRADFEVTSLRNIQHPQFSSTIQRDHLQNYIRICISRLTILFTRT